MGGLVRQGQDRRHPAGQQVLGSVGNRGPDAHYGVNVLVIFNVDSGPGKAVLDKAKSQGVATIDCDRLTLAGSAAYCVSFDNVAVGRLQGGGLIKCLTDDGKTKANIALLDGTPTDNNATLFKQRDGEAEAQDRRRQLQGRR